MHWVLLIDRLKTRFYRRCSSRYYINIIIGCGFLALTIIYLLIYQPLFQTRYDLSAVGRCLNSHFASKNLQLPMQESKTSLVGNGYIALDCNSPDAQLLLISTDSAQYLSTNFYPLVTIEIQSSPIRTPFRYLTDYKDGISKSVACTLIMDKCICAYQTIYVHRIKPKVLIQELRISNPSASTITATLNRKKPLKFDKHEINSVSTFSRTYLDEHKIKIAIACSTAPNFVTIKPKTEETFRFICTVEMEKLNNSSQLQMDEVMLTKTSKYFLEVFLEKSDELDLEHVAAWNYLNSGGSFNISHSKVNGLNTEKINDVKYALASTVRAPQLESNNLKANEHEFALSNCYSGHSTLLYPSKLWEDWSNIDELIKILDVWKMTLVARGCAFKNGGANSLIQAFLLSLTAATFTSQTTLEIALNPETELHRTIFVKNLQFGLVGFLNLTFDLDSSLTPFVLISSNASTLYACTAGCLDKPRLIGMLPIKMTIKVTKPATPILFISNRKTYLELLPRTLHVMEVIDAPAHQLHIIEAHKHGENKGLSTFFWVTLIVLIVLFHLFLLKILIAEWKNSGMQSYSKLNKKILLRRNIH